MNRNRTIIALLFLVWCQANALSQASSVDMQQASRYFGQGEFAEAVNAVSKVLVREPDNYQAVLLRGKIALLSNDLEEAGKWLGKAMNLKRDEVEPVELLAEVHYRRDEFQKAAPLFAAARKDVKAKKLESFKGASPYQIEGTTQIARVKFIHTDPLPLVQVQVNGGKEANFIIDTGGGEVILDTEFAKQAGAVQFGSQEWTFGGDRKAEMGEGKIESLTLGGFVVKNVPVNIINTQRFSAAARGKRVDGIIGTVLLYHFISTLDYPAGELILRRRTAENLKQIENEATSEKQIRVPFWLVGDHLMVAKGRLGSSKPALFYVDTGLAGLGFTGPKSIVEEAGIHLPEGSEVEGVGGGGTVKIVPFPVDALSLGDAREENLTGVFGAFPASLENKNGFRIAGIVSHQFFRDYAVTMDFSGMRLLLKRRMA